MSRNDLGPRHLFCAVRRGSRPPGPIHRRKSLWATDLENPPRITILSVEPVRLNNQRSGPRIAVSLLSTENRPAAAEK